MINVVPLEIDDFLNMLNGGVGFFSAPEIRCPYCGRVLHGIKHISGTTAWYGEDGKVTDFDLIEYHYHCKGCNKSFRIFNDNVVPVHWLFEIVKFDDGSKIIKATIINAFNKDIQLKKEVLMTQ